jgi:hypothetical protein
VSCGKGDFCTWYIRVGSVMRLREGMGRVEGKGESVGERGGT